MRSEIEAAKKAIFQQGPCLICGNPGEYAAHRLVDAQMARVSAGDPIEDVALDFDTTVQRMVTVWAALLEITCEQRDYDYEQKQQTS